MVKLQLVDEEEEANSKEDEEESEESNGEKSDDDWRMIKLPMISLEAFSIFSVGLACICVVLKSLLTNSFANVCRSMFSHSDYSDL